MAAHSIKVAIVISFDLNIMIFEDIFDTRKETIDIISSFFVVLWKLAITQGNFPFDYFNKNS